MSLEPKRCPPFELKGEALRRELNESRKQVTPRPTMPFQLSLGLRATADQQLARFHRERDRRRLRAMAASVVGAGLLVALVLGVVGLKVQQVQLSYRLDALRTMRTELEEANRRLSVERASLSSLGRIEDEARTRLGMVAASQQQVQLAREFAAPSTASAARLGERTAQAPPAAGVQERVR
jgi:cell division protein FtsL